MIRPLLTELVLFFVPFVLYAVFLWAAKRGRIFNSANWPVSHVVWLLVAALVLVIGSFFLFAHWGGAPPRSTYTPAHVEDGKFVPGLTK